MSETGNAVARYEPTHWWRAVLVADGSIWAESSNEREVRRHAATAPSPAVVQHLWQRTESEWRRAD
jgi:hypothetical protein